MKAGLFLIVLGCSTLAGMGNLHARDAPGAPDAPPAPNAPAVQPLPPPPADAAGLTRQTLPGGLEVWVHPAERGSGEVGVCLVIRAGSLDERDDQLGAAYLAKRAAGMGTPRADPDALSALGPSLGWRTSSFDPRLGEHARLGYETVTFTLAFDAGDEEAWRTALRHYADLLSGWRVEPGVIDQARSMAASRREDAPPEARARSLFMPELLAGDRLGARELIPVQTVLDATDAAAVQGFIDERYRPDRAVLIVAGDVDAGEALNRVRRVMDDAPDRPLAERPPPRPAISRPVAGRVSVHAVEGFHPAEVSLLGIEPGSLNPPADALGGAVLDAVAGELVGARVRVAVPLAEPGVVTVDTLAGSWIEGARIAEISVRVAPEGIQRAGQALARELARIAHHGFSHEQVRDARASVLASHERAAADWARADADTVMHELAAAAGDPRVWATPPERLKIAARVLATHTDDMLTEHARRRFRPDSLACVMLVPDDAGAVAPDTADAHRLLAIASGPAPGLDHAALPERLVQPEPSAPSGAVGSVSNDPATGVWSATLGNGVVVRARSMSDAGKALVRVTIADGVPREDAQTAGRTRDAVAAWRYPRTRGADAGVVRAWAIDRSLSFKAVARDHAVVIEIDGPEGSAPDALALAAALLAEPGVDHRLAARVTASDPDHGPALRRLGRLMFAPGEPRASAVPAVTGPDPDKADAWLARITRAPLEVSIVGAMSAEAVIRAAADSLGTLPPRPPPSRDRARDWGQLPRVEATDRSVAPIERHEVVVAIVFGDGADTAAVRPMLPAARAVDDELDRQRHEGLLHAADTSAWVWLGDGIPGRATLVVRAECDNDPDAVLEAIERAVGRVASGRTDAGVIEREIQRARAGVEKAWERPEFWADRLAALASCGLGIEALAGMRADYAALTPESVRQALADAAASGVRKRVIVSPE